MPDTLGSLNLFSQLLSSYTGADPQKNYAGVSIDTPHNFKFSASYLCFVSTKQDTTASGIDPTGVHVSTPSDLRCIFSAGR